MRISDVATFDIEKRRLRADASTNKPLYTWIPDWLVERLQTMHEAWHLRLGASTNEPMAELSHGFKVLSGYAGKFEQPPTPHRFRYTLIQNVL